MNSDLTNPTIPVAKKEPHEMTIHGDTRVDNYYWMKLSDEQKNAEVPDKQTQEVLNYLNEENKYTSESLKHLDGFREKLFNEIVGRIKQTDMSVPYFKNGFYYLTRYEKGKEYPIYSRRKDALTNPEQILLNVNELAEGYDYYNASSLNVSPDNKILGYGEDNVSRRIYTLRFKDLESGKMLDDVIPNTTGSLTWGNDNSTIFYTLSLIHI